MGPLFYPFGSPPPIQHRFGALQIISLSHGISLAFGDEVKTVVKLWFRHQDANFYRDGHKTTQNFD